MKLKINIWTGILDIFNCIVFAFSWFAIFASAVGDAFSNTHTLGGTATFFYFFAALGLILNIISLVKNKKYSISLVGPILGLIGNVLFLLGAIMAFPAIVLLIIATVFTFLQRPTNVRSQQNFQNQNYSNQNFNNNNYYQNQTPNNNQGYSDQPNNTPMTRSARHHR